MIRASILIAFLLSASISSAQFIDGFASSAKYPKKQSEAQYLAPNEYYPQQIVELTTDAPKGVHIAVGTERGFIGAALTDATHLLLVDINPATVWFNEVNTSLLALSTDREDYRHLRMKASHEEWLQRASVAKAQGEKTGVKFELVGDPGSFKAWQRFVRYLPRFTIFNEPLLEMPDKIEKLSELRAKGEGATVYDQLEIEHLRSFEGANYLLDDKLFEHIRSLARSGRIQSIQMNINDLKAADHLVNELARKNLRISTLDISNAWWPNYLADKGLFAKSMDTALLGWSYLRAFSKFGAVLERIQSQTHRNSVLLYTAYTQVFSQFNELRFYYSGVSFDQLRTEEGRSKLLGYFASRRGHYSVVDLEETRRLNVFLESEYTLEKATSESLISRFIPKLKSPVLKRTRTCRGVLATDY